MLESAMAFEKDDPKEPTSQPAVEYTEPPEDETETSDADTGLEKSEPAAPQTDAPMQYTEPPE
jgi:hypothetical protein